MHGRQPADLAWQNSHSDPSCLLASVWVLTRWPGAAGCVTFGAAHLDVAVRMVQAADVQQRFQPVQPALADACAKKESRSVV